MISNEQANAIFELNLDAIKVKLMHVESGEGWSREKANAVETQYRRFLVLMKMFPNEETAPLVDVDTFWHYHILDTMKYAADCQQAFGYFLHHFPYVGMGGEDDEQVRHNSGERMRELYEQTFGESYVQATQFDETGSAAYFGATGAKTAYCGATGARTAYCGATGARTAYCGATGAKTAYCGATGAKTAYCGATGAKTAYCGATGAKTAYCGATGAKTAYCGATGARTAYCGTINTKTAYCGTTIKSANNAAYCGATVSPETGSSTNFFVQFPVLAAG
jgi:hypothetical protein